VAHGHELRSGLPAHGLGGGGEASQLGEAALQAGQLTLERVVLGITDGGRVLQVVAAPVLLDLLAQLQHAPAHLLVHEATWGDAGAGTRPVLRASRIRKTVPLPKALSTSRRP
jgi:hypothetical protein